MRGKKYAISEVSNFKTHKFVYFLRCEDYVKIGRTTNLYLRFRHISELLPFDVQLLAIFPGGAKQESFYHRLFRHHRVKGEWFELNDEIWQELKSIQLRFI
jgi:hypothetical protein